MATQRKGSTVGQRRGSYGHQIVFARKVMRMKWPPTVSDDDAVIVQEETSPGRFVLYGRKGPQLACRTYAEAEARALSYAEHACACVWYLDARGCQLIGSFVRVPVSSPTNRPVRATPEPKGGGSAPSGYNIESTVFNKRA